MNVSKVLWALGSLIGAQQAVKVAQRFELDDLLGHVGLQRHRSATRLVLPAVGLVSLGIVVGAGAALLIAPSSGADLRKKLSERAEKLAENVNEVRKPQNTSPNASQPAEI